MPFTDILQSIAAFNFLFIAGMILFLRDRFKTPIFIFAFFLLGKGFTLTSNLIFLHAADIDSFFVINLAKILNGFLFSYAPVLYFFALSLKGEAFDWRKHWLHFLPFAIYLLIKIIAVVFSVIGWRPDAWSIFYIGLHQYLFIAYYTQVVGYTIAAYLAISKPPSNDKEVQQAQTNGQAIRWLRQVLLIFLLVWALFFSNFAASSLFGAPTLGLVFKTMGVGLLLLLSNITFFKSLSIPEAFFLDRRPLKSRPDKPSPQINEINFRKLQKAIKDSALYTNPDLRLQDLAKIIGLSTRNTSTLIKTFSGKNFYDFVNSFRIEEAKRLLLAEDSEASMLDILYQSGFNSKSVFNSVFKKNVGLTPSEFKKTSNSVNKR